jgi:phosphate starvation-inducible protein PhoH
LNKFRIEDTTVGELNEIFGTNEEHLALLEAHFGCEMILRGDELHILGEATIRNKVAVVVESLRQLYKKRTGDS